MDLAKLKEEMISDAKTDLTGVDLTQIRVSLYDLTDFEALDEFEQFIKTGRRVYHITTIDVPHLVVLSSPGGKHG
jgi:hypothetical protein